MSEAQNGGNQMKRLTYWNEEYRCWSYHCGSGEAANRLAAYEETGRTPEEVTALGKLFDYALEESKTLTEQLALLNRIRDLAEADRAGRLVVLPCKVGDTVWAILGDKKYACKCIVEYVNIGGRGLGTTIVLCEAEGLREQYGVTVAAFGKTVFLTREEADRALEGKRNA